MTDQAERYDRIAAGYARWWAPVLAPGVHGLLDRLAPAIAARHAPGPIRIVDVGTGTGQLAIEAIRRWPNVEITGIDASSGMAASAEAEADRALAKPDRPRFRAETAFADRMPLADGSMDVATSSFVLQLVPNRHRALREIRRVLRPEGVFASVTWLAESRSFEPDRILDDVLDEAGYDPPEEGPRTGDFASAERAANELRRAGFHDVEAHPDAIEHRYTVDGYLGFVVEFDEETLFAEMEPAERDSIIGELRARLARLSPAELTLRYPIVHAIARR